MGSRTILPGFESQFLLFTSSVILGKLCKLSVLQFAHFSRSIIIVCNLIDVSIE